MLGERCLPCIPEMKSCKVPSSQCVQDKEAHPPLLLEHPLDVPRTVLVPGTGHDILWATHECHWIVTSDAQAGTVTPLGCRGAWEVFMGMSWLEPCDS